MVPLFPPTTYVQTSRGPIKAIRLKVPVGIPTADGGLEIPNRVFVGGIPTETTELELETFFCDYGLVMDVRIVTDRITGESKGYGFVTFDENEDISKLLKTQTITMKGKKLRLRKAIRRNSSQFVDNSENSTSPNSITSSGSSHEKELSTKLNHLCVDENPSKSNPSNSEPVLLLRSQPAVESSTTSSHYASVPYSTNYQPMQPTFYPVTTSFPPVQQCTSSIPQQQQSYTQMQYFNQNGQIPQQINHPAYFIPIYPPQQPYGNYAYPLY